MSNKNLLDKYVGLHYDRLLEVSHNITRRFHKNGDNKHNLLHEVLLVLYEKIDEKNEFLKSDVDFIKYATATLKHYFNYMKNKKHDRKKDNCLFTFAPAYDEVAVDEFYHENREDLNADQMIYIDAENVDDATKLFLKDMKLNDIPIEKGIMVNRIKEIGLSLFGEEREVFDLYYLQEIDCLRIYNELKRTNTTSPTYARILSIQKEVRRKIISQLRW